MVDLDDGTAIDAGRVPFTVLVGNPRKGSRTLGVARAAGELLAAQLSGRHVPLRPPRLIDLAVGGREIAFADPVDLSAEALAPIVAPGLLLVATPTFKGSYSGLLKMVLDLLPRDGLSAVVAVPLMTAADPLHRDASHRFLQPLLHALGAEVPAPGIVVLESQFSQVEAVVTEWLGQHATHLADTLRRRYPARPPAGRQPLSRSLTEVRRR